VGARRAPVPPDEVDEVRIVSSWLAEHEASALPLEPAPAAREVAAFAAASAAA
jgi:hypothetical protein